MENKKTDKQLMVGVVILLVGAALLANNFRFFFLRNPQIPVSLGSNTNGAGDCFYR